MKTLKKLCKKISDLVKLINQSHIGAFAAQSAFFIVISTIPLLILILSFINLLNINVSDVYEYIDNSFGGALRGNSSVSLVSLSTILAAWCAARAFNSLRAGFHFILGLNQNDGYIRIKIRGIIVSVIFSAMFALIAIIGVFGKKWVNYFLYSLNVQSQIANLAEFIRKLFLVFVMFLVTYLLYNFLPDWRSWKSERKRAVKKRYLIVVSIIVSLSVYIYTVFFSMYVMNYAEYGNIYRNMTSLVCIMIIIYGAMYAVILGFKVVVLLLDNYSLGISNL